MDNKEQQQAISHKDGPMLVLAGPGSGKTFVLTRHIRFLITVHRVPPQSVLVITFTRAAAREMKERFFSLMEGTYHPVCFGTFHAVFFQLLRQYFGYHNVSMITHQERSAFLQSYGDKLGGFSVLELEAALTLFFHSQKSAQGKGCLSPEQLSALVNAYRAYCRKTGRLDLDDLANLLYSHLKESEAVRSELRSRFQYVLIDEYQDINASQYRVVKSLVAPRNNLFAVGDDDQSIYAFRGSNPGIMLSFEQEFPGSRIICLPVNFRSDQEILQAAEVLIRDNQKRFAKTSRAFSSERGKVEIRAYRTRREEEEALFEEFSRKQREGSLAQCALLCRNNRQLERFAAGLSRAKLPYVRREKLKSFFEEKEIRPLMAMLRFVSRFPARSDFLLFANLPPRGIRREAMTSERIDEKELINAHMDTPAVQERLRELFRRLSFIRDKAPLPAIRYLVKALSYDTLLEMQARVEGRPVWDKLELIEELAERSRGFLSIPEFLLFAEEYDASLAKPRETESKEGVFLYTMHGAKGLEFDTVFLPDLCDRVIPGSMALGRTQIEEERRLLYVAMTRARHRLVISYAENEPLGLKPSFFLEKIRKLLVKTPERG